MSFLIYFIKQTERRKGNSFARRKRVLYNYLKVVMKNAVEGVFHKANFTDYEEEVGRSGDSSRSPPIQSDLQND